MFSTKKEITAINSYFKKFLVQHRDEYSDELFKETVAKIESEGNTDFLKNWNNLMILLETIERIYDVKSIITERNYFRIEFHDNQNVQDKGSTKIEALFGCCYQILEKYWKEKAPYFNRGFEPFDEIDLA